MISTSKHYLAGFASIDDFRALVASQKLKIKQFNLQYTCCIGICNEANADLDVIMAHADKNLYRAKQMGRNQICSSHSNVAKDKSNEKLIST